MFSSVGGHKRATSGQIILALYDIPNNDKRHPIVPPIVCERTI
jgi:hypothetical protein